MTAADPTAYTLPGRRESGENYSYEHTYEVLAVLDADAGPCITCDQPLARLDVKQHVTHNGASYTMRFDFIYAHQDGTGTHASIVGALRPRARCNQCQAYAVTTKQEAYGDRSTCTACGHSEWYSIGD